MDNQLQNGNGEQEMTDAQALGIVVGATRHPTLALNFTDRNFVERALEKLAALVQVADAKNDPPAKLAAAK